MAALVMGWGLEDEGQELGVFGVEWVVVELVMGGMVVGLVVGLMAAEVVGMGGVLVEVEVRALGVGLGRVVVVLVALGWNEWLAEVIGEGE